MEELCLETQEAIAWGRSRTATQDAHARSCVTCSALDNGLRAMDDRVKKAAYVLPSSDFSDRVMARLGEFPPLQDRSSFDPVQNSRVFEMTLLAAAAVFLAVNLSSFLSPFLGI